MIKDGEMVFLHHEKSNYMIPFQKNTVFSTHKGNIRFEEGMEFGDRIVSTKDEEFFILKPSLCDWMMKVKRATNIIYGKDAGYIIIELGIQNGSKVIEIGTGSSSLTILLSRIVGKEGRIYSFEREEEHQKRALKNVDKLGIPENVEFTLKDPSETEDGFGLTDMDAVFIDVPEPWKLIEHAHRALKGGGHLGTLSPNIEQIQTTVDKLKEVGFARIQCTEILTRDIRVKKNMTRPYNRMIAHTAYLLFAQKINI